MAAGTTTGPARAGSSRDGGARRVGHEAPARQRAAWRRTATWSVLGTAVPGSGLVAAGRRVLGWAVLVPFLLVLGAVLAVVVSGRAVVVARQYAFSPTAMLVLAGLAAGVGLLWCLVVLVTHLVQRREQGVAGRRAASAVLLVVLLAVVAVPSATATRYALAERSLLQTVFGGDPTSGTGATPDATAEDPWAGTPRVTVLLVGADSSQGHEGTRPDTVIVASINTATGDTVLLNLPRQLEGFSFPAGSAAAAGWKAGCAANGQGGCLLNAAYLYGVQHPDYFPGAKDPGLAATREAASGITGLPIDYTAMVNLDGFEHLIDALGGITLTVPRDYPIGGGKILGSRGQVIGEYPVTGYVKAGVDQHLDGYQAEWFARSRSDSDNTDRMDRQRCLINAAVKQYGPLQLAQAFPALAASAEQDLTTDIPASALNAFVDLGLKVKSAPLRTISFDERLVDTADPDYDEVHALVQQAIAPPAPTTAPSATSAPSASASSSAATTATAAPSASASGSGSGESTTSASARASVAAAGAVDADAVCPS